VGASGGVNASLRGLKLAVSMFKGLRSWRHSVYIYMMLVTLLVKPVDQLHRRFGRQPFEVFSRFTFFLFKEEESIGIYLWELHDTVGGQRISTNGPRVLLSEYRNV